MRIPVRVVTVATAAAVVVVVALLLAFRLTGFGAVDRCLDGGGRWNADLAECER